MYFSKELMIEVKRAAVIARGWLGDSIACTAAATSLNQERGFNVDFYVKWPQLKDVLQYDSRFHVKLYTDTRIGRLKLFMNLQKYHVIIIEPESWSYAEPFTSEIRRMAGCSPRPDYSIILPRNTSEFVPSKFRKKLAISRDIYKRAYGRDVDSLMISLAENFDLIWVGLAQNQSSKDGFKNDLLSDAYKIAGADAFVGPEGGLLWLAGGLGVKTIYFTEHIDHVCQNANQGNPWDALGCQNLFPGENHVALPLYCSNYEAVEIINRLL